MGRAGGEMKMGGKWGYECGFERQMIVAMKAQAMKYTEYTRDTLKQPQLNGSLGL